MPVTAMYVACGCFPVRSSQVSATGDRRVLAGNVGGSEPHLPEPQRGEEKQEPALVAGAHAVAHHRAVVIEARHAAVAQRAVLGA